MSFSNSNKKEIIEANKTHTSDTGSPEVQIALLTTRLTSLQQHFSKHAKDFHSQRGMMRLVSRRKRLLAYLKNESVSRYKKTITALGLRK